MSRDKELLEKILRLEEKRENILYALLHQELPDAVTYNSKRSSRLWRMSWFFYLRTKLPNQNRVAHKCKMLWLNAMALVDHLP